MRLAAFGQTKKQPDIKRILRNKDLTAHFQQVVYVTRKTVCGMEGLIRGMEDGMPVSPKALFDTAQKKGLTLELDRMCREKVIEAFGLVYPQNKDKLLFLNLDASILDNVRGSGYLLGQVEKYGVNPQNIVVEINETKVQDSDALKTFIALYRKAGFLIALDDVGAGFSNLDRIPIVKPDIIKVDIGLVRNIQHDYHKQEVVKSLIRLATQIGAMVVAEGVETQEEAIETLRLGVNMIQGFYFSKPAELSEKPFANDRIDTLADNFKSYMTDTLQHERRTYKQIASIAKKALAELSTCDAFNERLHRIVGSHGVVECAYVLDENGIQCSDTVFGSGKCGSRENLIFYSACSGTDHSMKRYYLQITNDKRDKYMTEPYVSLATGNLCVTFAETFKSTDGKKYILCMDFCESEDACERP
jgi:EAL domain-containing protein (putative c-di-GMP-specific phosphodiesterase class I)